MQQATINDINYQQLYEALKKENLRSDYLHADETPVRVLDK
jgi:hypothetical protein